MNNPIHVTPEQEETALGWLSRLHNAPSRADQAAFSRWLLANPAHREAYAQAQVLWELCQQPASTLAMEDDAALRGYLQAMDARPPRTRRWAGALATAACLLVMIGVGAGWQPTHWLQDLDADYVSTPGKTRTVTLADHSQLTLDADSAVAVDFDHGERHVQLLRGAAFFHVTHTGQPFVVEAEGGDTQVLGTQFEVRLQPAGALVTVLSGRVGVTAAQGQAQQVLVAGQQLGYADGKAASVHGVDSESQLAWRDGWLNYYQASLAEVVQDLQRYYPGRILLLNEQLAQRKVSGSFRSDDPLAVLDSLRGVMGFEEHRLGRWVVLR
ncbi:FecR family protein [Pseudomonas sp. R5(2019)]|uniref:FecR family protein n=1 Tax=Pseudomonas sp. R5(2019) TaxID=2697566 RepID=UPI001412504B|nr:FecR family protein [Pseudomonas sp. R5(2019)]NBA95037.1 DUF4880 domain-containing protein [Pseudomonas sp. R5(2019)]